MTGRCLLVLPKHEGNVMESLFSASCILFNQHINIVWTGMQKICCGIEWRDDTLMLMLMLGLSSIACVLYPFSKAPPAKGSIICFILLRRNMDNILSSVSVFVVYSDTLCCFSISNYTYIYWMLVFRIGCWFFGQIIVNCNKSNDVSLLRVSCVLYIERVLL